MNVKRYIQLMLLLPLGLPLLAWTATGFHLDVESSLLSRATGLLLASLFGGGIPYVIFLAGILLWLRKKKALVFRRYICFVPLLYLVVFAIYWTVLFMFTEPVITQPLGEWMMDLAKSLGYFTLFILGFGYGYMAIGVAGYQVMRKIGWIKANRKESAV